MDGIINVYKEAGFTSFDVVAKLRGILKQKKIGHTGTLDPDAEGVLPICMGKATKVCEFLTEKDKIYRAVLRLGITTDTQDISGRVLREQPVDITEKALITVIEGFVGKQKQIPPMYSALKVNGQKLCDLARKGIEVERKAREIEIFSIHVISIKMPLVIMEVHCTKGTYIRTLCQDIGEAAGCGGCMQQLLRTKTAGFTIETAYKLAEIEKIVKGIDEENKRIEDVLVPVDMVLKDYPKVTAEKGTEKLLQNGNRISAEKIFFEGTLHTGTYRMYDSADAFIGLYSYHAKYHEFKPEKMFI